MENIPQICKLLLLLTSLAINLIDGSPLFPGTARISDGEAVDIANYPYQVSIQSQGSHICGGSVISDSWILSAAHCFIDQVTENLTIRVGSSFRDEGGAIYKVLEYIMHENYSSQKAEWDIGVAKIGGPIVLGEKVKVIKLAETEPEAGTLATATGWGRTPSSGLPRQLLMVQIPIIDFDVGEKTYPMLTKNMLCAGAYDDTKSVCSGDSGGPLTADGVQVGVVSFSTGACPPLVPAVYDNVAQFRSWIKEKSGV